MSADSVLTITWNESKTKKKHTVIEVSGGLYGKNPIIMKCTHPEDCFEKLDEIRNAARRQKSGSRPLDKSDTAKKIRAFIRSEFGDLIEAIDNLQPNSVIQMKNEGEHFPIEMCLLPNNQVVNSYLIVQRPIPVSGNKYEPFTGQTPQVRILKLSNFNGESTDRKNEDYVREDSEEYRLNIKFGFKIYKGQDFTETKQFIDLVKGDPTTALCIIGHAGENIDDPEASGIQIGSDYYSAEEIREKLETVDGSIRVGLVLLNICGGNTHTPEVAKVLVAQGARVVICPNVDVEDSHAANFSVSLITELKEKNLSIKEALSNLSPDLRQHYISYGDIEFKPWAADPGAPKKNVASMNRGEIHEKLVKSLMIEAMRKMD